MRRSQSSTSSDRKQKKREKALSSHHRVRRGRACDMAALRLVPGWTRTPMRKSGIRPISSRRPWSDGLASRGRRSGNGGNSCRASAEGSAETNPSVFLGSTPVLLFSAAEFGVLSLDLPTRNAVDEGVRDLVLAATDEETRATAREVSNVFPQAYLCLAALASAWLVFAASDGEGSRPYATRTRVGVAWATVGLAGVAVDLAKNLFGRVRPQLGLSSFAFPSGHTCAACVLSGVFLFLLLDPLLASKTSRDAPGTEPGTVAAKKTDLRQRSSMSARTLECGRSSGSWPPRSRRAGASRGTGTGCPTRWAARRWGRFFSRRRSWPSAPPRRERRGRGRSLPRDRFRASSRVDRECSS